MTEYESRSASVSCSPEEFYSFITDLRNFSDLVPGRSIEGWQPDADSCRFKVNPMGEITLKVADRSPYTDVKFSGTVLGSTNFDLYVSISEEPGAKTAVRLKMKADLNPVLQMVASGPIENFLEALVTEMEKFAGWKR